MIQDSKAEATTSTYRGSKCVSLKEMKEFSSGQWFWFWSLGLLTQLVLAPIWRCCLPAPHSICPLHTHLATFLDLAASWQSVVHLDRPPTCVPSAPHLASTLDSLAMRSLSELLNGIHRDGTPCCGALPFRDLGAQITAPAPACPYPLAPPCKAHLLFKESELNAGAHPHPYPPPAALLTLHSLNATGVSSLLHLSKHNHC